MNNPMEKLARRMPAGTYNPFYDIPQAPATPVPAAAAAYTPNWTSPGPAYGPAMAPYTPPAAAKTPFWTKNRAIGAGLAGAGAGAALIAAIVHNKRKNQTQQEV